MGALVLTCPYPSVDPRPHHPAGARLSHPSVDSWVLTGPDLGGL